MNLGRYFCIAGGPSLNNEDLGLLAEFDGKIIVVNNSWERYGNADIIFAGDYQWWSMYHSRAMTSQAELWTCDLKAAKEFSLHYFDGVGSFNSGLRAIELAVSLGANTVFLLGYDCSLKHGFHWHGPHQSGLQNPTENSICGWKKQFHRLSRMIKRTNIINCSSYTELDIGIQMSLRDAIKSCGSNSDME